MKLLYLQPLCLPVSIIVLILMQLAGKFYTEAVQASLKGVTFGSDGILVDGRRCSYTTPNPVWMLRRSATRL
jgi:hypothetical protein